MHRVCQSRFFVIAFSVASMAFSAPSLGADQAQRPTNAALLETAVSDAVNSLVQGIPASRASVVLVPAETGEATWMVESLLGGRLREEGCSVIVARGAGAGLMSGIAGADTAATDDTSGVRTSATGDRTTVLLLEYRVTELGIQYPRVWRSHYVGRKMLERLAYVSLHARLVEEESGNLLWVGEGRDTKRDAVPVSELSFLEGKGQEWQKGTLPPGKMGAFVEPLVVSAIVGGLVYLFYSNKE